VCQEIDSLLNAQQQVITQQIEPDNKAMEREGKEEEIILTITAKERREVLGKKVRCLKCRKRGHLRNQCTNPSRRQRKKMAMDNEVASEALLLEDLMSLVPAPPLDLEFEDDFELLLTF
jgi:hypothetical protein